MSEEESADSADLVEGAHTRALSGTFRRRNRHHRSSDGRRKGTTAWEYTAWGLIELAFELLSNSRCSRNPDFEGKVY
jgi:hypothetical protein